MEAMGKLIQMKVLIVGLRGLGVETAKNIILAGPNQVQLYDPAITSINDLGANFYLSQEDVGKTRRDEASVHKLAELNPYVHVQVLQGNNIVESAKNFNAVVITEFLPRPLLSEIDAVCRKNKSAFIYAAVLGLSGFVFDDFGEEHVIKDKNGEECSTYLAKVISNDGSVTIDDSIGGGKGKLSLGDGDYVTFKEVQGMNELNDGKPRQIKLISNVSFKILNEDLTKYGEYTGGGIIEQIKIPIKKSYAPFKERIVNFYDNNPIEPIDLAKFGRNELLFIVFQAIHEYYDKNNALPELNSSSQVSGIVTRAKEIFESSKNSSQKWAGNAQEWDPSIAENVARWARAEISPICAFLGGVVAQEIVKFTGKFTPIDQWMVFDFFETVENLDKQTDRSLKNCRYDDQIAIFGNEIQKKLADANIFMIGAGALGCEFLKNFALMGISLNKDKKVVVTDNDNIETSNLNRQFLFRKENVGHSKSKCACEAVKKMNSALNSEALQSRVGRENEHIFNEDFLGRQTFVINAVDNIQARKYVDNQCTNYGKVLIDSGTLGTKAHVQLIVPHVTSCYNDSQDPPEEGVPMCTMHNFPSMIEHCIEWGRDKFGADFVDSVSDTKKLVENEEMFYVDLKKEGNSTMQLTKLKEILSLLHLLSSSSFEKVIEFSIMQYTEYFVYRIKQLLYNFPEDYKNKDGSMFWSGSKRVPHPIPFDVGDELAYGFVKNYAVVLGRALGIKGDISDTHIKEVASKVKIPEFVPKKVHIKTSDKEPAEEDVNSEQSKEDQEILSIKKEIHGILGKQIDSSKIHPEEFEKDDDSNGHIDWIHACSNLRARNYKIKECDRQKTKMIAGKIIPAIATTTAAVTGIVSLQMYTLLQTNKIEALRGCFMNLAINSVLMSEPEAAIQMKDKDYDPLLLGPVKAIPPKWTVWDKIVIDGSKTCQQLIDHIKEKYNVDVSVITANGVTIIQTFMPSSKARLGKTIEEIYNEQSKIKLSENVKCLILDISGDIDDATALMPVFRYVFKK